MKTSPNTPRTPRKTASTVAKAAPAEKKVTVPRARSAAPKKAKAPTSPSAGEAPGLSVDEVRFRAYEIYRQRDGQGDEVSDWLQAERELLSQAG